MKSKQLLNKILDFSLLRVKIRKSLKKGKLLD